MNNDSMAGQTHTTEEIGRWIRRYRESGLGLRVFALKHGLPPSRLHYWVYTPRYACLDRPVPKAPVFAEISLPAGLPGTGWAMELGLSDGATARFSAAASPAWIASVVQALRSPC